MAHHLETGSFFPCVISALLLARRLQTEIAFWFCVLLLCVIVLKVHLSATAAEDIYPLSGRHTATVRSDYRGERECVYVREGKRERGGSERERESQIHSVFEREAV